jgi:hypothetical protein
MLEDQDLRTTGGPEPKPLFFPSFFRGLKSAATPGRIANVSMSVFHLLRIDIQ